MAVTDVRIPNSLKELLMSRFLPQLGNSFINSCRRIGGGMLISKLVIASNHSCSYLQKKCFSQ
uniref:Pyruvate dehydrogenase E1 component subunit alpha n=1 Tax=Rhizophora mucronata TaxID=61149 RepID=A0A2P2N9E6_RHIMU